MLNRNTPEGLLPKSLAKRNVAGLRDYSLPSEMRIYKVNPDGTVGELKDIIPENEVALYTPTFMRMQTTR